MLSVDLGFILEAMNVISKEKIVEVIVIIIGSSVGFVLLWWGSRVITRNILKAFKTGKLEIDNNYKGYRSHRIYPPKNKDEPILKWDPNEIWDMEYNAPVDGDWW